MISNHYVYGRKSQLPIILKIDTSLPGVNAKSFLIPTTRGDAGNINFYTYRIDWGDGNSNLGVTGDIEHTYETDGIYIVKIYGIFPNFYFNNRGDCKRLIEVVSWGNIDFSLTQTASFFGCSNLIKIASKGIWFNKITSAHSMFSNCGLTELPDDMLLSELIIGGTNNTGGGIFNNCKLTSLPPLMKLDKLTSGYSMFAGNFFKTLPLEMTLPNAINTGYMFFNNILNSLSNLSLPKCTTSDSMFRGNAGIISLPNTMLLPELTNGVGMFANCKLTSLPPLMTLDNLQISGTGNSNGAMFQNNVLTDLPAGMTLKNLNKGVGMFSGNIINTVRYSQLLQDMNLLNSNSNVNFHAGGSKYNSSATSAKENLTNNKGWTITDSGII